MHFPKIPSQVVGGRGLEAHEIRALSGNVSQDGAVLGTKKVQPFTCKLYTLSKRTVDITTMRGQDCLFMHTMHTNYQAGIWSCSLQQHPQVPSPVKCGWVRNDAHSRMGGRT